MRTNRWCMFHEELIAAGADMNVRAIYVSIVFLSTTQTEIHTKKEQTYHAVAIYRYSLLKLPFSRRAAFKTADEQNIIILKEFF